MTNREAIEDLKSCIGCGVYEKTALIAINALEKTSDKECSRCRDKGKCAIYDNFNIDYCSDWSMKYDK